MRYSGVWAGDGQIIKKTAAYKKKSGGPAPALFCRLDGKVNVSARRQIRQPESWRDSPCRPSPVAGPPYSAGASPPAWWAAAAAWASWWAAVEAWAASRAAVAAWAGEPDTAVAAAVPGKRGLDPVWPLLARRVADKRQAAPGGHSAPAGLGDL